MSSSLPLLIIISFMLVIEAQSSFRIKTHTSSKSLDPGMISPTPTSIYYVEAEVGNPQYPVRLAVDTVSPLTWLQSADCELCFPISFTFDPRNSTSFKRLPSTSSICSPPVGFPTSNGCLYDVVGTKGYLGVDQFFLSSHLSTSTGASAQIAFGCGINNTVRFDTGLGFDIIGGMIGLGRGHPSSILSQLSSDRFSYCLSSPDVPEDPNRQPTLDFGADAYINQTIRGLQTTLLAGDSSYNYLNLTLMRLNGEIVFMAVNPSQPKGKYVILDTRSPLTKLVNEAFYGLQSGAVDYFAKSYGWTQPIDPGKTKSGYDLCYNLPKNMSASDIVFPAVEMEFLGGAIFQLRRAFVTLEDVREVCMTIVLMYPGGPNVVGVDQQMGFRFLFDYAESTVSYAPDMC